MIIIDWNMPNMNGLDFVKKVRNTKYFKEILIIMVTIKGEKKVIMDIKAKVNNYIVKPFTPQVLREKLFSIF